MLFISVVILVLLIAAFVYVQNLKDVYYGYGQAVAYISHFDAKVTYKKGTLKFEVREGYTDHYMEGLADSVCKLLLKNGFANKVNIEKPA